MALENIAMNVSEINYVISVSADACHDASLSCVNLVVFRTVYYYVPGLTQSPAMAMYVFVIDTE